MRSALAPLLLVAGCAAGTPAPATPRAGETLPFVDDDYARARQDALRRHVLLVVDGWAPW